MTERPPGDDWWQGPDGRWRPPESRPAGRPAGIPSDPDSLDPRLTTTTAAVLGGAAVASMGSAVALAMESGRFDADAIRSAPTVTGALGSASVAVTIWSLAAGVAAILLIVWVYRAYRAALRRGPTGTSWSPGWAIGGWLIPFANLVIPKLVVNEIDRITSPGVTGEPVGDRWRARPVMAAGHWWWASLVVSMFVLASGLGLVAEQIDSISLVESTYRAGLRTTAVGMALYGAASGAGAVLVTTLGRRFRREGDR